MASNPATKPARRSLIALLIIVVALIGVISIGVFRGETTWTPKLALDLQGGTQIILAAQQSTGEAVTGEQLDQAVAIIRQRVDASGVSESEIATMGSQNISVSIPGKADDATLQRIEASAQLDFRPVLAVADGTSAGTVETPDDDADAAVDGDEKAADTEDAKSGDADAAGDAATGDEGSDDSTDATADSAVDPDPIPDTAYDDAWLTEGLISKFNAFVCTPDATLGLSEAPRDRPLITCDAEQPIKYILGPVEMGGDTIEDATAQMETTQQGATTGQWAVQMKLNDEGTKTFGEISQRASAKLGIYWALVAMFAAVVWLSVNETAYMFYVIAGAAGFAIAGLQASSRTMVAKLAPGGHNAEYFGLFAVAGRSSSVAGPAIFGWVAASMADWYAAGGMEAGDAEQAGMRIAIYVILAFLTAGTFILFFVEEDAGSGFAAPEQA